LLVALSDPRREQHLQMKLDLDTAEEAFPGHLKAVDTVTRWATKPEGSVARRVARQAAGLAVTSYKASENMFTGSAQYMRRMLANKELAIVEKSGGNLSDKKVLRGMGNLTNALTSRGGMEQSGIVKAVFWAPKMVIGNIDILTMHGLDVFRKPENRLDAHARFRAAVQLAQIVTGIAGVLGLAAIVSPGSVEPDPASADFGKIKAGSTRFDVTFGMGSLVTLAWRLITGRSKSSSTGKTTRLNTKGYRGRNYFDVIVDFLTNKVTPPLGELIQHAKGEDRNAPRIKGKPVKPTVLGSAVNLVKPFPLKTLQELLQDPERANVVGAMIADGMGISTNTYPDVLPPEAGQLLSAVDVYEYIVQEAKDAGKAVGMSTTARGKRLSRAKVLIWDTQNEWEDKGGDKKRMFEKTAAMATAVLNDRLIFGKFAPANYRELAFAYGEIYHAKAGRAMAGEIPTDFAPAMARLGKTANRLGISSTKVLVAARASVRAAYSNAMNDAVKGRDEALFRSLVRASVALQTSPRMIHDRYETRAKEAIKKGVPREAAIRDLVWVKKALRLARR